MLAAMSTRGLLHHVGSELPLNLLLHSTRHTLPTMKLGPMQLPPHATCCLPVCGEQ